MIFMWLSWLILYHPYQHEKIGGEILLTIITFPKLKINISKWFYNKDIPSENRTTAFKYPNSVLSISSLFTVRTNWWILHTVSATSFTLVVSASPWPGAAILDCWWDTTRLNKEGMDTWSAIWANPRTNKGAQARRTSSTWR